jgi:hypothetical protein
MKRYLIFFLILFSSCSQYEGSKDSLNYDNVTVEFDGYSEQYETREKIVIPVTDSNYVKKLNKLKNSSERKWFGNVKGTDYIIRLNYTDSKTGDQLLVRILKSINSTPSIEYGPGTLLDGTFKNDELINFVSTIINLKDIEQYNGSLGQREYETIVRPNQSTDR